MWYEIIPPLAIISACIFAPLYTSFYSHKLILGKWCKRDLLDMHDKHHFDRDEQLTGFPYDTLGLDAIPDVPLTKANRPRASEP